MSWKPIDVAPRDGARIVVAFRSPVTEEVSVAISWWDPAEGWQSDGDGDEEPEMMSGLVPFAWVDLPES